MFLGPVMFTKSMVGLMNLFLKQSFLDTLKKFNGYFKDYIK